MSKVNDKSKPVTSEKDKKPDKSKEVAKTGNEKIKLETSETEHSKRDDKAVSRHDKGSKNIVSKPTTPEKSEKSFDIILDRSMSSKGSKKGHSKEKNNKKKKGHPHDEDKKKPKKEKKKEKKILPLDQQSIFKFLNIPS